MNRAYGLAAHSRYNSPPVQRAARLLRHIAEGDPVANMGRTARALGINRTTLLRLLHTLEAEHFIEPRGEDIQGWRIGLGLITLAISTHSDDLVPIALPVLERLTERTGLSSHLGVLDGRDIVYLVRQAPRNAFSSNIRVGSRLPAHAVNLGRIILAHLPTEAVSTLFAGSALPATTPRSPVTIAQLREMLDADFRQGLAWSDNYYEDGISSVAVAIFGASGKPVAAVNVAGQSILLEEARRRDEVAAAVLDCADEISKRLGWRGAEAAGA